MASGEFSSSPEVRTGFILGDTFGYRRVQYCVIDGKAIFEGDIVLDGRLIAEINVEPGILPAVVITGQRFRWPDGVVPFTIDPALPNVARVNDAIAHWHARTNIRFIAARANEENFVTFMPGNECSSPVGMQGGQQFITLDNGCGTGNTIHEIGHAVGLWHEQSRDDRDNFVRINWLNIVPGEERNFNQHISDGDDVGSYDFGSIMHYPTWAFSRNDQPTIETLNGEAIGQRVGLSDGDVQAVNFMYFPVIPVILQSGVYTIRQQSNGRFVDAHESSGNVTKDFTLVTRPEQNNDSQRWILTPVGGIYTIRQKSTGRFVDAHEGPWGRFDDFTLVTREAQHNDSQRWILNHLGQNVYTIQQKSNGRFVDAHDEEAGKDFTLVTRPEQHNDTQRWILNHLGQNVYTIQHKSTGRFVDAYEFQEDFSLVTRPKENSDTQRWLLTPISVFYTTQQKSNGRFVDAHDGPWGPFDDFALVTREAQHDDSQRWILNYMGGDIIDDILFGGQKVFTFQQKSTGRFADAHEIQEKDFALVTRPEQNNDTQRWLFKRFAPLVLI
jgi:hypothetical protein